MYMVVSMIMCKSVCACVVKMPHRETVVLRKKGA